MADGVVESVGDRFDDVVENVKLRESVTHVLRYAQEIADNDGGDIEAHNCVKVLKSMQANTIEHIGYLID